MRQLALILTGLVTALGTAPALADTPTVPPGNPCLRGNGNPCRGNNGNLGAQGNASGERVRIDRHPPAIDMTMPAVHGRGAYVDQIGDSSTATIVQTARNAYASVKQSGGSRNEADVSQTGTGTGYVAATQAGSDNFARIQQGGSGQNVALVTQNGSGNWLWSNQQAGAGLFNGARLTQAGNNNDMSLTQNGSDNRAALTQQGDGNGMSVVQNGAGNRLTWVQQGNNLTDLQIIQNGGAANGGQLLITQTNK